MGPRRLSRFRFFSLRLLAYYCASVVYVPARFIPELGPELKEGVGTLCLYQEESIPFCSPCILVIPHNPDIARPFALEEISPELPCLLSFFCRHCSVTIENDEGVCQLGVTYGF